MASYYRTFVAADLDAGVLVVDHGLGEKHPLVVLYDNLGREVPLAPTGSMLQSIKQTDSPDVITLSLDSTAFEFLPPETTYAVRVVT